MDDQTIEKRLADLEKEVAELKAEMRKPPDKNAWLKKVFGRFKDDPVYDEAMRLGAAWRQRENRKSLKELERQDLIDADPGHRPLDGNRSSKRRRSKTAKATGTSGR